MANRFTSILRFASLLTVEPLVFFSIFITIIKKTAMDQMAQDKICMQKYNLSFQYCHDLPTMHNDTTGFRTKILADVTQFNLIIFAAITVPIILISLQVGPFIDKYKPAKKMLVIYSGLVFLTESVILLANAFFFDITYILLYFCGSMMAFSVGPLLTITCAWAYVSSVTPANKRPIRMVLLEVGLAGASLLATFLSGNIIDLHPLFPSRETRNYCCIYLISIACTLIYLIISIFLVNEDRDKERFARYFPDDPKELEELEKKNKISNQNEDDQRSPWKLLFDLRNIKEMGKTIVQKRPHGLRAQIIVLFASKLLFQVVSTAPTTFLYQYVQKVYSWKASQYSNYIATCNLINIGTTFVFAPLLIKVLKVPDMWYTQIGYFMALIQNIVRLSSSRIGAFYASMPFYTLNAIAQVGMQAYITRVTTADEFGRIFSLLAVADSAIPLVASLIFSSMFKATADTIPNIVFAVTATVLVIGIALNFFVCFKAKRTLELVEIDRKAKSDNDQNGISKSNGNEL